MQFFMSVFNDALKEHKKEIFALNVDVYQLGSNIDRKGADTLCESGFKLEHTITSICLRA